MPRVSEAEMARRRKIAAKLPLSEWRRLLQLDVSPPPWERAKHAKKKPAPRAKPSRKRAPSRAKRG